MRAKAIRTRFPNGPYGASFLYLRLLFGGRSGESRACTFFGLTAPGRQEGPTSYGVRGRGHKIDLLPIPHCGNFSRYPVDQGRRHQGPAPVWRRAPRSLLFELRSYMGGVRPQNVPYYFILSQLLRFYRGSYGIGAGTSMAPSWCMYARPFLA